MIGRGILLSLLLPKTCKLLLLRTSRTPALASFLLVAELGMADTVKLPRIGPAPMVLVPLALAHLDSSHLVTLADVIKVRIAKALLL